MNSKLTLAITGAAGDLGSILRKQMTGSNLLSDVEIPCVLLTVIVHVQNVASVSWRSPRTH